MNIGILAHVDAGKTTITEQMLHICGVTKAVGRVDNGNATTDGMALERARGITIRQTTVTMHYNDHKINLLDTPGHVDFIAEVERSLGVLDAAVLVISAKEGVQTQTKVIYNALRKMKIPTILMINKVDRMGVDMASVISQVQNELTDALFMTNGVSEVGTRTPTLRPLHDSEHNQNTEVVTLLDEGLYENMNQDLEIEHSVLIESAKSLFMKGELMPVVHGSALLGLGVLELLELITNWVQPLTQENLSAVIFKVDRDGSGYRRCFTRIFGGVLVLRESYQIYGEEDTYKILKMDALQGIKTQRCDVATAGDVVVLYTDQLKVGSILGEPPLERTLIHIASPTLKAKVLDDDLAMRRSICDALTQLTDEDPFLDFEINQETQAIELRIFGMVQKEIIEQLLLERFGISTQILEPEVIYKAKPLHPGEACIHMYKDGNFLAATVGLVIEPLPLGQGVVYHTEVSFGDLKKTFQNAVREGSLRGVKKGLDGCEITDARIRFVYSAFDSVNSTPSDYRKVSEEVVALALNACGKILLEPMYNFELWVPNLLIGRAIADVLKMRGSFEDPSLKGDMAVLKGRIPQVTAQYYEVELADYTGGKGIMTLIPDGYEPVKTDLQKCDAI